MKGANPNHSIDWERTKKDDEVMKQQEKRQMKPKHEG